MEEFPVLKELSDEELAVEAQAGSRRGFEELVHRYTHRLFHYLRPRIPTDQDTEDLVQETFLKAYRNIGGFNLKYKFSTWLYTIANRLLISFYRKKQVEKTDAAAAVVPQDPQERMIREEDSKNIWNVAQTLHQDQYQVLWLRYMEDLSIKEIAGVVKKNQVYVRVLLHRARLNLMKHVNPSAFPGDARDPGKVEKAVPVGELYNI